MKTGAIYIRVSTIDQVEYSPESQLRLIKDYANKNSIIIYDEHIYRDEGISGRNAEKRPAFQQMISEAKRMPKPFDVILVYSSSRFARNHEQSIVYRSMLERECGIEIVSITQPNVDKKTDMLTNAIYSIIDEWYSLDLSDNVRRGMTQKAMEGGYQTSPPFGYEFKHKGAILSVKEDEASIVRHIFKKFLEDNSKWAIARDLKSKGIKSKRGSDIGTRSLYYMLRNPVYKGYIRWTPDKRVYWDFKNESTIISKGKHAPIIDEETFDAVQHKLDDQEKLTKSKARPTETTKHWLSGLIKCSNCGKSLNYNGASATKKIALFRCGGYGKGICNQANFIQVLKAESILIAYLTSAVSDINILYDSSIHQPDISFNEINHLNAELSKARKKLDRATKAYLEGAFEVEQYKEIKASTENEIKICCEKLASYNNKPKLNYLALQKDVNNVCEVLKNDKFDKNEKQTAARTIIEKIVFNKKCGEFKIYFYR